MTFIDRIKKLFLNKQFIIFIIIGIVNTISSAIFASLYSILIGEIEAFIPGYITGIIVSYMLNTLFTFKERFQWKQLIQFTFSTVPNFIIQLIIVYIGVSLLNMPAIICYGVAAVIGVPVTFLILKLLVYRNK